MNAYVLGFLLLFTSFLGSASGMVTNIRVDTDVVYFLTSNGKPLQSPACVNAQNSDEWSMSLLTETGKAAYALLVTATASGRDVTVESANDCNIVDGWERAQSVELEPALESTEVTQLYLYQGDGVTKVGRIVKVIDVDEYLYVSPANSSELLTYNAEEVMYVNGHTLYFTSSDCTGSPYTSSNVRDSQGTIGRNPSYSNSSYFTGDTSNNHKGSESKLDELGVCVMKSSTSTVYLADFNARHPVCGENICQIKDQ